MNEAVRVRAAVVDEPGALPRIEEVVVRPPREGEVRVRVAACGICASDLHVWRTGEGIQFPAVLGHEAAGVIEALGPGVEHLVEGERVVLSWVPRCGRCRACLAGRFHVCAAIRTDANDGSLSRGDRALGRYMSVSGLSERVVVAASSVVPVPDALPLRLACLIGCGVTTGLGAAMLSGEAGQGESVAVFGCGGVGLSAIQGARIAEAAIRIAVDPNQARLALAEGLGATHLLSVTGAEAVAAIRELTEGGVDLAIESVGSAAVAREAFDALAPGGRAVVVGLTGFDAEVRIPMVALLLDKTLRGSIHGSADPQRDFPRFFDFAMAGELRLEEMSGPDFPLDRVADAFEALASGSAVRPRVVLDADLA